MGDRALCQPNSATTKIGVVPGVALMNQAAGVHAPLGSLCTFDSPRNPTCTRRRREDATDACEAGWPLAACARHVRSEALSTDHVLDSVGVAGSLKLDHRRRHWQYNNNELSP